MNLTRPTTIGPALLAITLFTGPTVQADEAKALHEQHCVACHGNEVYTRDDRRVTAMSGLQAQVSRCENNLGLQWFDDQREGVVNYLNSSYYHF